jgi:hypothetical protein
LSRKGKIVGSVAPLSGPTIGIVENTIHIAAGVATKADVWLVRYDPRTINVEIGAGENSGATIAHRNIVRQLSRLGAWGGKAESYPIPVSPNPAWRAAILVQGENGDPIMSAAVF